MDKVEKLVEKTAKESSEKLKGGFIGHVFNFDEETKNQIFNLVQYSLLSIIPVVLLNKTIQKFIPEADDTKSNVELLAEIVGQTVILFVGMFFIHRLVTYVPTYSKVCYESFSLVSIVLSFLVIILSLPLCSIIKPDPTPTILLFFLLPIKTTLLEKLLKISPAPLYLG